MELEVKTQIEFDQVHINMNVPCITIDAKITPTMGRSYHEASKVHMTIGIPHDLMELLEEIIKRETETYLTK